MKGTVLLLGAYNTHRPIMWSLWIMPTVQPETGIEYGDWCCLHNPPGLIIKLACHKVLWSEFPMCSLFVRLFSPSSLPRFPHRMFYSPVYLNLHLSVALREFFVSACLPVVFLLWYLYPCSGCKLSVNLPVCASTCVCICLCVHLPVCASACVCFCILHFPIPIL